MNKFLENSSIKNILNKILLIFIFYIVAAASFNGYFVKWGLRDFNVEFAFKEMYYGTAHRPFVHRQLMITIAKTISNSMPDKIKSKLTARIKQENFIEFYYKLVDIKPELIMEYYVVYFMAFAFLFMSMFIWREIGYEITGSQTAGAIAACAFTLLFPIFETGGGYFYDTGEILFFSLSTLLAIKGYWFALIILSPIAEYNKESFLFFILTLFPLLMVKLSKSKAAIVTAVSVILSGLVYLYVSNLYAANMGGAVEIHLMRRLELIFSGWTDLELTYGVIFGSGTFILYIIFIAYLAISTWGKLPMQWQNHLKFALIINVPLYIIFCWTGELRNLSMLYVGFFAMLSIFIKEMLIKERIC